MKRFVDVNKFEMRKINLGNRLDRCGKYNDGILRVSIPASEGHEQHLPIPKMEAVQPSSSAFGAIHHIGLLIPFPRLPVVLPYI